jgi:hypothetical protein
MVVHAYNPNTLEAEAGGYVQGHPVSKTKKKTSPLVTSLIIALLYTRCQVQSGVPYT